MQPSKRSNSSDLSLPGPPAKRMPEPNDTNKPSILKALEAVLAAGRRGLLGPAAMAAVEAMPDLQLEFCDGKVGQETPSSASLVEKKKKEATVVNKKRDTVVAVMPPVEGVGNQQTTIKEVWICGNSVISQSSVRAKYSFLGLQLGYPPSAAFLYWQGIPNMLWDDLLPMLHQTYHRRSFPSIILIHVGETDLLLDSRCSLVTRMQNDLGILRRAFPDVVIIWSSLLPKCFWKPSENPQVIHTVRSKVNFQMGKYCNINGICYIPHPRITAAKKKSLFSTDNTLSTRGTDIFITDLKNALMPYLIPNKF